MASIKQIIGVLGVSIMLVALIGWWVDKNNQPPELLVPVDQELPGPLSPEELQANSGETTNVMNRIAVFETTEGVIELELFEDTMPITTGNFVKLVGEGFYNGTKFHRIIDNFMIQGGDPNTKGDNTLSYGTGGPGYTIEDEFVEGPLLSNVRGTIAMANTGQPNSGGSQFFINTKDNTFLDFNKEPFTSRHPVFGRVIAGMDVVDKISKVQTGERDIPVTPVVIRSVTIREQGS